MAITIDPYLVKLVEEGKVVLFLGSGASREAKKANGEKAFMADALQTALCDRFLGGYSKARSLDHASSLATSRSDIVTVQEFVRDIYEDLIPTPAHTLVSDFRWHAIATTNYDLLLETAYSQNSKAVQKLVPFLEDSNRIQTKLSQPNTIPYVKLHGCITNVENPDIPLILTKDSYVDYEKNRTRLYSAMIEWVMERPLLFVGYSLDDTNIRQILDAANKIAKSPPRGYIVSPGMDDIQSSYWESHRLTGIKASFDEFMDALNQAASPFRGVKIVTANPALPIFQRFSRNATVHPATLSFIENDVDYVESIDNTERIDPKDFYKGLNPGWAAIRENLDARRDIADQILVDRILIEEDKHANRMELVLIKAHAGAGKSVLLRRIAWEAAKSYKCLCFYLRENAVINAAALQEVIQQANQRVYLFVDNVADHVNEISSLYKNIGAEGKRLTVVSAERINEWNVGCDSIKELVNHAYEVEYLNDKEIDRLLALLEHHSALGTLEEIKPDERRQAFEEKAGKQLLVILHEATSGKPFEEILQNEYDNIKPPKAQQIYMNVCVLNRMDIPVRAGIIARLHGIGFEDFEKDFFGPLEHVVRAYYENSVRDMVYTARHPYVAEIVFNSVLISQEEKYDAYIRCLRHLNISFESDRKAFRQMTRSRNVLEIFSNHDLATRIFDEAANIVGSSGPDYIHYLHQKATYEFRRPNGNLRDAYTMLSTAIGLVDTDNAIKHSMVLLQIKSADELARTPLEADQYLKRAIALGQKIISARTGTSHGYHATIQALLNRYQRVLNREEVFVEYPIEAVDKEIQRCFNDAFQQFPSDPYLLESRSQYEALLHNDDAAFASLHAAFLGNPRNTFVAISLSRRYEEKSDDNQAQAVLREALDANPAEKRLHFAFAKILMKQGKGSNEALLQHFKSSFTPGDRNYEAQLLYGRQLFVNGDLSGSQTVFLELRNARTPDELKHKIDFPVPGEFQGRVRRLEANYCLFVRESSGDTVFAAKRDVDPDAWRYLVYNARVRFRIGFTIKGPAAFEVRTVS